MDQGLLPRRYAKALYKFAAENGDTAVMYTMMQNLADAFMATPRLQSTVANPFIDVDKKAAIVTTAAQAPADKAAQLADLVKLLVKNNRIDILREIALAYTRLYRQENKIYKVEVQSAAPLGDADRKRLTQIIAEKLGNAKAEMSFTVNPELIGGFVVNIDNTRLDASILNELQQLRQKLMA